MRVPCFQLDQTEDEVIIKIIAKYANVKETEIYVEDTEFLFHSPPFFLRLNLPGKIVENDLSTGSYDCDTGTFLLKFSKVNKGEHFDDLDMIVKLLSPQQKNKPLKPSIEVIENPLVADAILEETTEEHDLHCDQASSMAGINLNMLVNRPKYGFANQTYHALEAFDAGLLKDVVDLPEPDSTKMNERKILRETDEQKMFNDDHYMADLVQEDEEIISIINFQPEWENLKCENIEYTIQEMDILKELKNFDYLLDGEMPKVLCGLVDILFASCYNHRTTFGENTSESSWTINKISATLSWFDYFDNMEEVIRTSIRRSLCYPQYRHWNLSLKVFEDVKKVIKLGKKYILKRLCEIHTLFNDSHEPRHILNLLYIDHYMIWIQKVDIKWINSIIDELENIVPQKNSMGFHLVEIETAVWTTIDEANQELSVEEKNSPQHASNSPEYFINEIVHEVDKLVLNDENSGESTCSEDEDSESSSTSCSSSSTSSSSSSTSSTSTSSTSDSFESSPR